MKKLHTSSMHFRPASVYDWPSSTPAHVWSTSPIAIRRSLKGTISVCCSLQQCWDKVWSSYCDLKIPPSLVPDSSPAPLLALPALTFDTPVMPAQFFNRARQSCHWTWYMLHVLSGSPYSHFLYFLSTNSQPSLPLLLLLGSLPCWPLTRFSDSMYIQKKTH